MNQFYYEARAKEKVRELRQEGQRSQAFHRSGAPKVGLFSSLQKLIARLLRGTAASERMSAGDAHVKAVRTEYGD